MIEYIDKKNPLYCSSKLLWNRLIKKSPEAIAYCNCESDVQKAVLFAKENNLPIRVRSGGHNYAGFSTGDNALIIDLTNLNKISLNRTEQTVTAQGGTYLEQIYNLLGDSDYPFPGGSCPTVGISGVTLGGGWGYSARKFGLTCDSLLEATMVDYKGCLLTANSTTNSSLFWALRGGGGGNFGIVTSLKFKIPNKVCKVTQFTLSFNNPSESTQIEFFKLWQDWISNVCNDINMKVSISNSVSKGINILCTGLLYDNPNKLTSLLSPFSTLPGYNLNYNYTSFLQAIQIIASVYPQHDSFIDYSRFAQKNYDLNTIKTLLDMVNTSIPKNTNSIALNFHGLGGAISDFSKDQTAFYYRKSKYILSIEADFDTPCDTNAGNNWITSNKDFIYSITNGSYINFPYIPLLNYRTDYYGCNYKYLKDIKCHYDPNNIFTHPQGI